MSYLSDLTMDKKGTVKRLKEQGWSHQAIYQVYPMLSQHAVTRNNKVAVDRNVEMCLNNKQLVALFVAVRDKYDVEKLAEKVGVAVDAVETFGVAVSLIYKMVQKSVTVLQFEVMLRSIAAGDSANKASVMSGISYAMVNKFTLGVYNARPCEFRC